MTIATTFLRLLCSHPDWGGWWWDRRARIVVVKPPPCSHDDRGTPSPDDKKGSKLPIIVAAVAGVVEQVIIRGPVAPSWKKGPYVVRGRGPRADYG